MKKLDLLVRLHIAQSVLKPLVYDDGVSCDSALYAFLYTALSSVDNAVLHTEEYIEHD